MTQKQIRRWLICGGGAWSLAGLGVLGWALLVSIHIPVKQADGAAQAMRVDEVDHRDGQDDGLNLQSLQSLTRINLRRPLRDPPPVQVAPPPMQAKLMGTIYEPSSPAQSQALFRLGDGTQRFFQAGQRFQEAGGTVFIQHVGDQITTIEYRNERRDLTVTNP